MLVTEFGLFLQGAQDNFIQPHVDLYFSGWWFEFARWQFAGEHFIEDDAERIDVGAAVDTSGIGHLFGGAVAGRPNGALRGVLGHGRSGGLAAIDGPQHFGDTEVGDFHATVFVEQQVLGFNVAVNDPAVVSELQCVAQRRHDGQRLLGSEFPRTQELPEIRAVHEFHEQEIKPARLPEVVNRDNVRMI